MSRESQSDNRRNGGGPADRASFMVDTEELIEPNTTGDEIAAGYTVGPNAPAGGPSPQAYTVGSRGGPCMDMGGEEPD